jgi:hypothetical protein
LQAAHTELQEDHSILKEELGQLEQKHNETLKQLNESHASVKKVSRGKLVTEERYKHFHGEHRKLMHGLRKVETKAANYLHQLSFASRVRDATWADVIHFGFETFRTWWRDPAQKVDLNSVNIEDILYTSEAIRCLFSLGSEEMPEVVGITEFDYHPPTPKPKAAEDSEKAKEASGDAEAAPVLQDPPVASRGDK